MNVIITGAGRGLALELTRLHVEKGDFVYALAHSITPDLERLGADNKNINCYKADVASEADISQIFSGIADNSIDIIYNVAGIWYEDQMVGVADTDVAKALKMYEVNALAPLIVMKYGKRLLKNDSLIVNVSSEAGSITESQRKMEYGYCMSKAALNMASKIVSNELRDRNIRVFCYHPGWLRTQMGGERAAASSLSITAAESAERLLNIINSGTRDESIAFFDYKNEDWKF